eukprot:CAMPEP_0119377990 /NCGR_PEP_ID=MMETSP1334-20130426/47336_1 /TAXON_ID=127549 /ORGANISM="Calcidiscus leptoporus, Strain RCC1130" /LENGTH=224 /DNA_ID=CAMNT_0007397083 /DNA_START=157 /DNA_END=831 /DNA_ORIENTATION=+
MGDSSRWGRAPANGKRRQFFLDADADAFQVVMSYMRSGNTTLPLNEELSSRVVLLARYLGVDGLLDALKASVYREQTGIPAMKRKVSKLKCEFQTLKLLSEKQSRQSQRVAEEEQLNEAKAAYKSKRAKLQAVQKLHGRHSASQRKLHHYLVELLESLEVEEAGALSEEELSESGAGAAVDPLLGDSDDEEEDLVGARGDSDSSDDDESEEVDSEEHEHASDED